eukprot:229155-Hanusia_phi.AAC.2
MRFGIDSQGCPRKPCPLSHSPRSPGPLFFPVLPFNPRSSVLPTVASSLCPRISLLSLSLSLSLDTSSLLSLPSLPVLSRGFIHPSA